MTQSKQQIEELKDLQSKSRELRNQRKKTAVKQEIESGPSPETPSTAQPQAASAESEDELASTFESLVRELEEVASERPALALLAAFSVGFVVGQLFRRT